MSDFVAQNLNTLQRGMALLRNDISSAQQRKVAADESAIEPLNVHNVVAAYLAWYLSALQRRVSEFVRLNEDGFRKAIRKFVARSSNASSAEEADELQRRLVDVLFGGLHLGRRVRVQLAAAEGALLPLRRPLSAVLAAAARTAAGRCFPTSLLGMTPMHIACLTGDATALSSLLRGPAAALALRTPHSLTGLRPLEVAAQGGRTQVVHAILQHIRGNPNPLGDGSLLRIPGAAGRSPLQLAAEGGHTGVVDAILGALQDIAEAEHGTQDTESGNSLSLWNSLRGIVFAEHETQETTPAAAAAAEKQPAAAAAGSAALRDAAQDVAWCVAHTAAAEGHVGVLRSVLSFLRRADEAAGRSAPTPEDASCVSSILELRVGPHRNSPLHMAAHRGHADCVLEVFRWGASVVSLNCHNESALHLAVLGGHLGALAALLENADAGSCLHSSAPYSESRAFIRSTPKQYKLLPVLAVNTGFVPGLQALLAAGADPLERDYRGWSALSRALYRGQTAATRACEAACITAGRDIAMGPLPAGEGGKGGAKRTPGGVGNVAAPRDAWCVRVSLGGWHISSTPPQPAVSMFLPGVPTDEPLRLQLQWADPIGVLHALPSTTPRASVLRAAPGSARNAADELGDGLSAPPPVPVQTPPAPGGARGRRGTVDYDGSLDDLRAADLVALRAVLDVFRPASETPLATADKDGGTTGTQRSPEFELIPHSAAVYAMPPLCSSGGGLHSRVAQVKVDIPQPTVAPGQWLAASAVDMSRRQNEMDCSHIFAVHGSGRQLPRGALTVLVSSASGRRLAWGSIAAAAMWRSEFATSEAEHMCLPDVARTEGQVMVTLFRADDTSSPCGTACVRFTAAPPTEGGLCAADVAGVRRRLESPAAGKAHLVGHRGAGADSTKAPLGKGHAATRRTHVAENSLLSFTTAAANGASWVEFDVQLSKDGVPVIHHDFNVKVPGTSITVPITELTATQLAEITGGGGGGAGGQAAAPAPPRATRSGSFSSTDSGQAAAAQRLKHQLAALGVDATAHFKASRVREGLHDSALTLKDCFKRVPADTGFNIEVKYPSPDELRLSGVRVVNRAAYVHAVLAVVAACAGDRRVYFSSFDPDVCWLLAREQCQYAVFLLTEAGTGMCPDPRRNSLRAAVQFAVAHGLTGIVSECDCIVRSPRIVTAVLEAGLQLFTYGRRNNDEAAVALQVEAGVQGIIVDHVAHIAKAMAQGSAAK